MNPRDTFLQDILNIAVEGGINYWCVILEENTADIVITPHDDSAIYRVSLSRADGAITRVLDGSIEVSSSIREAIREAVDEVDAGYIDADCSDVIVQVAIFGKIVYG